MRSSEYGGLTWDEQLANNQNSGALLPVALEQGQEPPIRQGRAECESSLDARIMMYLTTQIKLLLHHTAHYAPVIQQHRLNLIQHMPNPTPPEFNKLARSLIKHLRAIGKWWRVMIAADPKGWCNLEGATTGVGWWWGAVGGVVAQSDGAVSNDGELKSACE